MKIRKKKRRSGQAVIEFLAVLGLYFFLISFMFTGFQLMYSKIVMNVSAYNGARYASLYQQNGDIARAKQQALEIMNLNAFNDTTPTKVDIVRKGNYVTCSVTKEIDLLFPVMNPNNFTQVIGDKVLTETFTMRVENQSRIK